MKYRINFLIALAGCLVSAVTFAAEPLNWTDWRGPEASRSLDQGNYPDNFGADSYLWRSELPGKGCSTPILLEDQIFLTAPDEGHDSLLCIGVDGNEQWRAKFGKEDAGKHRNGSGSNASPVTDGDAVFVFFKSGTFAAVERDGTVRWKTDLVQRFGKDTLFWDHGTSPVLTEKYVVMARMHQGDSWLAAFDKASGEMAWKVARDYQTPVECDHGYTTPLVIRYQGKEAILTWGAEHITVHLAVSGRMVWSCGDFNPEANKLWPAIASPVVVDDTIVIAYGRNDRGVPRLHGVRLSGSGDVTATNHLWKREDVGTFVPSPAIHNGRIIVVGDRGNVECLDPNSGKTIWKGEFPRNRANFYASPLIVGDKLYAPREDGVVFVASIADDQFKVLAENDLGQSVIGSPVPAGSGLLMRTPEYLYCFAQQN